MQKPEHFIPAATGPFTTLGSRMRRDEVNAAQGRSTQAPYSGGSPARIAKQGTRARLTSTPQGREGRSGRERLVCTIDDVRFIGVTLWTDFRLKAGALDEAWAHHEVGRAAPDFTGAMRDSNAHNGLLTTQESARRHGDDRAFIEDQLAKAREDGLTPVVITHHAPSPRCIRPWFEKSRLNPGFASNLDALIEKYQPVLWVHGHMHDPVDEWVGSTRIIANPHGFSRVEGHTFNPALVVNVPSERHRER